MKILCIGDLRSSLTHDRVDMINQFADVKVYSRYGNGQSITADYSLPFMVSLRLHHFVEWLYLIVIYFKTRPDIIQVFWANHGIMNIPLGLMGDKVVVTVMGGDIMQDQAYVGIRTNWILFLLKRANIITAKSKFIEDRLIELGIKQASIKRISWGVELNQLPDDNIESLQLRKKHGINDDSLVFFSCRRCQELYRIQEILEAFTKLTVNDFDAHLLITTVSASESYLNNLHKIVNLKNLSSKVSFLPELQQTEMLAYYQLSDVAISYAKSDGMPQSLYEAMATGCFPLFGRIPQIQELLTHNENSYLAENEEALFEGLKWCLENKSKLSIVCDHNKELVMNVANRDVEITKLEGLYTQLSN